MLWRRSSKRICCENSSLRMWYFMCKNWECFLVQKMPMHFCEKCYILLRQRCNPYCLSRTAGHGCVKNNRCFLYKKRGPKYTQNEPKSAQKGTKWMKNWPGGKECNEGSAWWAQEAPKRVQKRPKRSVHLFWVFRKAPKWANLFWRKRVRRRL